MRANRRQKAEGRKQEAQGSAWPPSPFCLLLILLVLLPLAFCRWTADPFELNKLLLLLLATAILVAVDLPGLLQSFVGLRRDLVAWGFLFGLGSAVASTLTSVSPLTSVRGDAQNCAGLLTVTASAVLFLLIRRHCPTPELGRYLMTGLVVAVAAAASYAVVQAAGWDPIPWTDGSSVRGFVRPFATLGHPNFLSAYLVMAFPFLLLFIAGAVRRRAWWAVFVLALVMLLAGIAVLASLSRGAWLGLASALVVFLVGSLLLHWKAEGGRLKVAFLIPAFGLLLLAVCWGLGLFGPLGERLAGLADLGGRRYIWEAGLRIFLDHPVFGCGLDSFGVVFSRYRTPAYWQVEWDATATHGHNSIVQLLATQGLTGLLSAAFLWFALLHSGRRAWYRVSPADRLTLLAVLAGVVGMAVVGLFGILPIPCGVLFVTWSAMISAWTSTPLIASEARPPRAEGLLSWGHLLAGVGLLVLTLNWVVPCWRASWLCRQARDCAPGDPRALDLLVEAIGLDPSCEGHRVVLAATAHRHYGLSSDPNLRRTLLQQAEQALAQATVLVAARASHHADLGRVLANRVREEGGSPAKALAAFDRAMNADPANPYLYTDAGKLAAEFGDLRHARTLAASGLALYPSHPALQVLAGWLALEEGQSQRGLQLLEDAARGDWRGCEDGRQELLDFLARLRCSATSPVP